jgi:membrane peptidoglycan carboxypeptidase
VPGDRTNRPASTWTPSIRSRRVARGLGFVRRRWNLLLAGAALAFLALPAYLFLGTVPLPSPPQSTTLLASDGQVIGSLRGVEDRVPVPLSKVSPFLPKAVVATEDRTFYEPSGVSIRGVLRAITTNVREGGLTEGGSTITQQYVRNAFASVGRKRSVFRKIREATLAIKVERGSSKEKILELYLNTVYFGRGAYGAEGAARTYFGKPAADLTLGEAAYVAGVIRSPDRSFDAALQVRNEVLGDMVRNRAITRAEADAATAEKLEFHLAAPPAPTTPKAAFFVEYVAGSCTRSSI